MVLTPQTTLLLYFLLELWATVLDADALFRGGPVCTLCCAVPCMLASCRQTSQGVRGAQVVLGHATSHHAVLDCSVPWHFCVYMYILDACTSQILLSAC